MGEANARRQRLATVRGGVLACVRKCAHASVGVYICVWLRERERAEGARTNVLSALGGRASELVEQLPRIQLHLNVPICLRQTFAPAGEKTNKQKAADAQAGKQTKSPRRHPLTLWPCAGVQAVCSRTVHES